MFLTPHTSLALLITTKVTNPLLAFVLGVISHFVLDFIPHGDEDFARHQKTKRGKLFYLLRISIVDLLLASSLLYFFISRYPYFKESVLLGAVSGAWLPDMLWISLEQLKFNFSSWYLTFHQRIHNIIKFRYSFVYGVPFQIVVTLAMIKTVFN
ncbi:MAG: hypothetical protein COV55_01890 [Candidatus Komeilibacteria bacterium CG11_big_fil_rev_8_21_14_0_20_36_20]|uniref:Uncharacterized protein n=1 Tax=Candidatus Komeilibacteria bacterium CG11_big_fil_rev_8_21_14_0_20_36_20 TaxID=1974477 RepID=A0A2H0NE44_9BACT|nr:MAG: hypothetical protein COV55_01890 [Candidatus Komeilibacteria bacterium CG11_big_fil_rev_8_21_14_0_20_36_20]PIR81290.1 MAG: hypothetical protein COU21_04875 [Candidatus Komeilibacteria bacterium CG10_big_fil_rev_8_21_14_0_10_36_65]PJC55254.1 MAG: hypothetical protein CO027_03815 [Candidatus Komeilibacteria bacterium CG_4_9_14_0_2_um_filter_36_13]